MRKFIIIGIIFFILFSVIYSRAEAFNLIVEEGKVRLSVPPGSMKTRVINVKNSSAEPIFIRAYLEDWYYLPGADGSKEFKPAGTTPLSCANWINFTPAEFTIPAYGKQAVNYIVKVPPGVFGGRYAVLFFESIVNEPNSEEGVGFGVVVRMGSLFYIEPEGTINRKISLDNFSVEKKSRNLPLTVSLNLTNSGNVDITASGTFHIIDNTGMVFARGEFNEVYTFPADKAVLKGEWKEPLPAGKYDLVITLDLGKALEEANMGRGPIIVKEADLEIGPSGEILSVSELK